MTAAAAHPHPSVRPRAPAPAETTTRQRLLQAGAQLFLSQGFAETSLDQVRQAAQASNGSLYHHFPTRSHLARALYLEALADYHAALLPVLDKAPPAAAGVRALVIRHIAWLQRQPQHARVLVTLRDATRIDDRSADWADVNAEAFGRLDAWLRDEVAAGRMHRMDLPTFMALVFAPLIQLTGAWLKSPRPTVPRSLQQQLADAAVRAVATTPAATAPSSTRRSAPPR